MQNRQNIRLADSLRMIIKYHVFLVGLLTHSATELFLRQYRTNLMVQLRWQFFRQTIQIDNGDTGGTDWEICDV